VNDGFEASVAITDPELSAREAGLRYVSGHEPGIRRLNGTGGKFRYVHDDGRAVKDAPTLGRIRSLVIPPAWTDVWICANPNGHLQVTGRDARGRKQYRYHARWREARDSAKYEHMIGFAKALPRIRSRVRRDSARRQLSREKVLATIVRLLEVTLIRVGNEEYARSNQSFGLSTMRDRHLAVQGETVRFRFRGKAGKSHSIEIADRRLARVLQRLQDLPGQRLFQYEDADGTLRDIESGDVNDYLREVTGADFTAKDFRTWAGTVLAAMALHEAEKFDSDAQAKRNIVAAIERTAAQLGNTAAICRKCYVHPHVFDAYLDGTLTQMLAKKAETRMRESLTRLRPDETAVLAMLQRRLRINASREAKRNSISPKRPSRPKCPSPSRTPRSSRRP
jgi:DNA topoisomerase-1